MFNIVNMIFDTMEKVVTIFDLGKCGAHKTKRPDHRPFSFWKITQQKA